MTGTTTGREWFIYSSARACSKSKSGCICLIFADTMDRTEKLSQHAHFFTATWSVYKAGDFARRACPCPDSLVSGLSARVQKLNCTGSTVAQKKKNGIMRRCRGGASCTPGWMSVQYVAYATDPEHGRRYCCTDLTNKATVCDYCWDGTIHMISDLSR